MASSFAGLSTNIPARVLKHGRAPSRLLTIRPLRRSGPRPCGLFISVCIADLGSVILLSLCELFAKTDCWTWGAIVWEEILREDILPASQELELGASRSPRHTKSWFVALIGSAFFITTWRPEKPRYFFMATNRYNHAVVSIDLTIKLFLWRQDRVALIDGGTATTRRQQLRSN